MNTIDPTKPSDTAGVVLVTGTGIVPPEACEFIEDRGYSVRLVEEDHLSDRQLHEQLVGTCGYLIGGEEKPKAEHFDHAKKLQVVAWVGTDFRSGVPGWQRAYDLGIAVVSTPGENAMSVAEFTLLLMLGIARPFTEHVSAKSTGDGNAAPADPPVGIELHGRTLGIVGAGRIGALVARAAVQGFAMNVLYAAPRRNEVLETELGLEYVALTELLERSDIVSLHRPGLADGEPPTLGRAELEHARPGALLVNTAPPGLVDLDALLWAIENRGLRAAFDEVGAEGTWARLNALGPDRFLSVPHMGARTREASLRAGMRAARAVCDVLSGQDPDSVNNPDFRAKWHR
jgi:D-3-phosphoglycerate dehydrogenase